MRTSCLCVSSSGSCTSLKCGLRLGDSALACNARQQDQQGGRFLGGNIVVNIIEKAHGRTERAYRSFLTHTHIALVLYLLPEAS